MSKIEWTNKTWNPIIGCSKISPGCDNCYAEKMAGRLSNMKQSHKSYSKVVVWRQSNNTDMYYGKGKWNNETHVCEDSFFKPLKWKTPSMIFVCSMGDLFHETVHFQSIIQVMHVINMMPQHTFQILTKRPERMKEFFLDCAYNPYSNPEKDLPNLWIGVTAENQETANKRIPVLLQIPAKIRFVSIEPMLENINIEKYLIPGADGTIEEIEKYHDYIDWIICGGETGHKARPIKLSWLLHILNQSISYNVPFFFKSWGKGKSGSLIFGKEFKNFPKTK